MALENSRIETIFWPSCIMDRSLSDQLAVAAAGGFDSLAVAPCAIKSALAEGHSFSDLRDMAAEAGVRFGFLDGVSGWLPQWHPTEGDATFCEMIRQRFDINTDEALSMGAELGAEAVVAVGAFDRGALDRDTVVRGFADFCVAALAHGLRTSLEFIPFWGIPEIGDALDILSAAACPDAGLALDTWHMHRGSSNFAHDMELLHRIPCDIPIDIQLADACAGTGWGDLLSDVEYRGFPGEGQLDIIAMTSAVLAKGSLKTIGPEVFGSIISAMPNRALGERSGETTRAILSRTHAAT